MKVTFTTNNSQRCLVISELEEEFLSTKGLSFLILRILEIQFSTESCIFIVGNAQSYAIHMKWALVISSSVLELSAGFAKKLFKKSEIELYLRYPQSQFWSPFYMVWRQEE